jgi:hypothetical protein
LELGEQHDVVECVDEREAAHLLGGDLGAAHVLLRERAGESAVCRPLARHLPKGPAARVYASAALIKLGVICDAFDWSAVTVELEAEQWSWRPAHGSFPTVDELQQLDLLVLVGPLANVGVARQLSGVVKLALEKSRATFVFAYPVHIENADAAFLDDFGHPLSHGNRPNSVFGYPDEFHEYFTQYGQSGEAFFSSMVDQATIIGWISENQGSTAPTALCWESEIGVVYVTPFFLSNAGDPASMLTSLVTAVSAHRDALAVGLPPYVAALRLGSTEEDLLTHIADLQQEIDAKTAAAQALEHWRHLVGRTSGSPLVELVVDALNVVLEDTGVTAEQRPDVGAEDFWIVGDAGTDVALAEAKGQGGGIGRKDVNQVDDHREKRGLPSPDFPGLLVINTFRGDADLERKQSDLPPNVVSLATSQNVMVMRTWDLYQLVGRKLDGEDVGGPLLAALRAPEGGWLKIDPEDGVSLITV